MSKVKIFQPVKKEVLQRDSTVQGQRNALGYVRKEDVEQTIEAIKNAFTEAGIPAYSQTRYHNQHEVIIHHHALVDEIHDLAKQKTNKDKPVGLFLEPVYTSYDPAKGSIRDENRYMIWIYFTMREKALTRFKTFCLENIFEYEQEGMKV